ncbi:MAG: hypothetical protein HFG80_04810 [Eubacterium sp.]|nr:hypothetical protein [Eubacterium sp.]
MEEKEIIRFELFGSFPGRKYRKIGKKTLSFLQYLIVNHSRSISAEELIDTFWTENDSSDPANALRNMLYKIRNLLRELFPEQKELLQTLPGCYAWNPEIQVELDTERFEKICFQARKSSNEDNYRLLREAVALYKGDFLSGNDSEWVKELRQYYRTLYLDACKTLLPQLEEKKQWMEMAGICSQAYQTDFSMEEFTAYQMQAYIAVGQPEEAIKKYETYQKRLLEELDMFPSEKLEQLYTLTLGLGREQNVDDGEFFRMVCEGDFDQNAFFCSFGIFRSIVALEKRHLARSGQTSTLVIVSLGNETALSADARRLERILQEGLRTGDPVARLTAGSYILMLTGTDPENAQIVTNRIDRTFHKNYRHSGAKLSFRISALYPAEPPN